MARTLRTGFEIEFLTNIRGHHVYKNTWCPKPDEKLICRKDNREDAIRYDEFSIGVYKDEKLVGHIPSEISELLTHFIENSTTSKLTAFPTGKRKREFGLVACAKFVAICQDETNAQILMTKLTEKQKVLDLNVRSTLKYRPIFIN